MILFSSAKRNERRKGGRGSSKEREEKVEDGGLRRAIHGIDGVEADARMHKKEERKKTHEEERVRGRFCSFGGV